MTTIKRGFRARPAGDGPGYPQARDARRLAAALGAAAALAAGLAACGAAPQPDYSPEPDPTEDAGMADAGEDGGEAP